ncbi:MAG: hypothetical protein FWE54_06585 [Methanimicrococcus sp.]|nr:hypothetical protein [Methanimicrococcus sp.]
MSSSVPNFRILDLKSYLQCYSPESILSDLSSFKLRDGCDEFYHFLQAHPDENGKRKDNFIDFEKKHLCRVYFVLAEKIEDTTDKCILKLKSGNYPVYGYFSISVKTLYQNNIEKNQEILPTKNINMYLIGHLCKNASYDWNKGGEYMLQQCFEIIESVHQKIGMEYILIECEPELIDYYSNQNFEKIGKNKDLNQMVCKVTDVSKNLKKE